MAFCAKCGVQVGDDAQFCPACGQAMQAAPVESAPPPQQAPPPPPPQQQYQAPPPQQAPPTPPPPSPPQQQYQAPPPPQQQYQAPPPPPPPQQHYQAPPQQGYQAPPPQGYGQPQQGYQQPAYGQYQQPGYGPPQSDAEANKGMAVLSYIGILFLIPLCMGVHKTSPFAKFHLNQGIILAIVAAGWGVLNAIITAILTAALLTSLGGWAIYGTITTILGLVWILPLVLMILGIVNSVKGEMKPLPIIGNLFTILK